MQCGGQKTALLWPLQPLQPLHFERFCRVLPLSFSIFISSFLYFFIMSELDFWDSSAVWSSLDQPPLGLSTTCSANSILPVPVAPSTTWCGKAKIEFMSGEFLKMGRWEGMICSQYGPLTPICLSALKGKALVCIKPFEVSKLSETWKGADVPHVQRSCFRSCWKSIQFIRNKRSVEELSKSALLDLLAKMVSKKTRWKADKWTWLLPPLIIASCIQHILVGWELGNRYNQAFMNAGNSERQPVIKPVSAWTWFRFAFALKTLPNSDLQERVTANCTNHVSIFLFFYSTDKRRRKAKMFKKQRRTRKEQKNTKQQKEEQKREHDNLFHFHSRTWVCVDTMNTEPKCCITNLANLVCYSRVNSLLTKLTV